VEEEMNTGKTIAFPEFTGIRCLMMPYAQGYSASVPEKYHAYKEIIDSVFLEKGKIGFLTIDESPVRAGNAHRGDRAKYDRALHTEAGRKPGTITYRWGGNWGGHENVMLAPDVRILLANNLNESCAVWDVEHEDTSIDGDIGYAAGLYPYEDAAFMKAGEVHDIGILTPHESIPVRQDFDRQFLRIVGAGVSGREEYFTQNPLVPYV
jgi:hypothetical protein